MLIGHQYNKPEKINFGIFSDSSPDRWGRVLLNRREAFRSLSEKRNERVLLERDFLLGVYDNYLMGGLRFKLAINGDFQDYDHEQSAPPMKSLRELEPASHISN